MLVELRAERAPLGVVEWESVRARVELKASRRINAAQRMWLKVTISSDFEVGKLQISHETHLATPICLQIKLAYYVSMCVYVVFSLSSALLYLLFNTYVSKFAFVNCMKKHATLYDVNGNVTFKSVSPKLSPKIKSDNNDLYIIYIL